MAPAHPRPSQTPGSQTPDRPVAHRRLADQSAHRPGSFAGRRNAARRRTQRTFLSVLTAVLLAAAAGVTSAASPAAASATYPVPYSFAAGIGAELLSPGSAPPGSNDFSCKPSAAHPYPVVLVHGTFADMTDSWQALSPLLADHGYCVFALNYGGSPGNLFQGYQEISAGAGELAAFVDQVLAATGAAKVDIVGHSQGGMMPRYYLDFLGGAAKVDALVGLSPSNHGTNLDGLFGLLAAFPGGSSFLGSLCAACTEQAVGSSFLTHLNAGGDTVPGVRYTVIATKYDEVVTPYSTQFLAGSQVTNITLQNQCGIDFADHLAVIYDPVALNDVLNALDPAHQIPVGCTFVLPVLGG
ncbi:alpha/beta fold hydrolase [Actinocrinis puniceicyclus]|uniref:Alpha/beta fold hydrolase n=1 Tax=Actinocrinis puniceicyclus TaxID=977794 RepID=A0A8J7WLU1_9ACTN|nr:alpha/beta fold hydrolase [Actinocrinis puniceicyclus]MBS2964753.1 alpha/beta fold hydrolase [Actinocrinis puniceicyclus]